MILDFKNGLPELFEEAGRVRMEPPSSGTCPKGTRNKHTQIRGVMCSARFVLAK